MNVRSRLIQAFLIVLLVWAALTVYVMRRFSPDGCVFDQSLLEITAFGALLFSFVCTFVVMAVQALVRSLNRLAFKWGVSIAALVLFSFLSDQAVIVASEAVFKAALPLLDSPTGMETCLAWFTPNFLNGGDVLFSTLMFAFVFSTIVSLVFFGKDMFGNRPVKVTEKRRQ